MQSQCASTHNMSQQTPSHVTKQVPGMQHRNVVVFLLSPDAPGAVEDLELVYSTQSDLHLQWIRPSDLPSVVPVSYYINITNTDTASVEQVHTYIGAACFFSSLHKLSPDVLFL